ncbi:hypothetical protein BDN70DRAFT_148164 [Pholiota conissans]|uniref:Uncharacterized protein n=1 Tax=Pholiota conissans TaxID=109636 RepID=A0A9P5YY71_9AGAR|nr:hypothetical protein BDN70DRAFT_148164 [Pholiota conissans]
MPCPRLRYTYSRRTVPHLLHYGQLLFPWSQRPRVLGLLAWPALLLPKNTLRSGALKTITASPLLYAYQHAPNHYVCIARSYRCRDVVHTFTILQHINNSSAIT